MVDPQDAQKGACGTVPPQEGHVTTGPRVTVAYLDTVGTGPSSVAWVGCTYPMVGGDGSGWRLNNAYPTTKDTTNEMANPISPAKPRIWAMIQLTIIANSTFASCPFKSRNSKKSLLVRMVDAVVSY